MKIYVSGSVDEKDIIIKIASYYSENYKCIITRPWWTIRPNNETDRSMFAIKDEIAIKECDIFILYNSGNKTSGKFIELGIAIALNKKIFVYGKPLTSVFRCKTYYIGDINELK